MKNQKPPEQPKEPGFVDALIDLLIEQRPELKDDRKAIRAAICQHFGGDRYYVEAGNPAAEEKARAALAMFNGRNAREVARRLGIGRSSVYRYIKQAPGRAW